MFTEPLFSIPAIIIMIGCFIGLKVVSANQRTISGANAIAGGLLVLILVCAGTLFWYEFLRDAITDKAELGIIQRANSFRAQAQGISDEAGISGKNVVIIATSFIEEDALNAMSETFKENGSSSVEVKYVDNKRGGYTRLPQSSGMMMGLPTYSSRDVDAAAKGADVIVCVATMPQVFGRAGALRKSDDMTKNGKVIFVAAGENQYPQTVLREMLQNGYITYAVTLKEYLPQYDRLDGDPAAEFETFYGIYAKGDSIPDIPTDE